MEMSTPGVTSQVELTGAEITVRCLQEEKVPFVFGYPGGAILPIYDEMFKQDKVKHILVRHEQAAVHAVTSGRARASANPATNAASAHHARAAASHGFTHPA